MLSYFENLPHLLLKFLMKEFNRDLKGYYLQIIIICPNMLCHYLALSSSEILNDMTLQYILLLSREHKVSALLWDFLINSESVNTSSTLDHKPTKEDPLIDSTF